MGRRLAASSGLSMSASYPPPDRAVATRRTPRINVVVVAPHPDDDAIGCGGILARLAARGARIGVIYVTDGSASHPNSRRFPPVVLRDIREREALGALRRLGVRTAPVFLRAPDSGLAALGTAARAQLSARIAASVTARGGRVVFVPWLRDPHPDHVATAELVDAALATLERPPEVLHYRVWLPVRGASRDEPSEREADTFDLALTPHEIARKRSAILAHRSQTGALVDDDPAGFVIGDELLAGWLAPFERFYRRTSPGAGRTQA